jgi:hypothetical protein
MTARCDLQNVFTSESFLVGPLKSWQQNPGSLIGRSQSLRKTAENFRGLHKFNWYAVSEESFKKERVFLEISQLSASIINYPI